eukprot:1945170-Ditylum_brightwellii.AAC.1
MASSTSSRSSWPVMKLPSSAASSSLIQRDPKGDIISVIGNMNYVTHSTKLIKARRDVSGSDVGGLIGAEWCPTDVVIQNARRNGLDISSGGDHCAGVEKKMTLH